MTTIADPKVKTNVTYRTVLLKAADVIRQRGHYANGAESPDGRVCVMAALGLAREQLGVPWKHDLNAQVHCAIQREIGGGECPVEWNYRQDAASVIDMFERAATAKG